ncbi:MAG: hypothetical protein E6Q67_00740 [Roseateles sp.]|nr:MAG: hypothetical protein E6Q67_00740 [Roseateles sp.]
MAAKTHDQPPASEAYSMACRETRKVWQSGSLLAKVRTQHHREALRLLQEGTPAELAEFVTGVAGPLFPGKAALADHPMTRNGQKLASVALEAILQAVLLPVRPAQETRMALIDEAIKSWVDTGRLPAGATGETGDAHRIADLLEEQARAHAAAMPAKGRSSQPGPQLRLAVVATLAPALTTLEFIAGAPEGAIGAGLHATDSGAGKEAPDGLGDPASSPGVR